MHAATGHEHALDGVHVGDDRVQRQRLVRREPGVHRLEAEDALQALVVEERGDLLAELAEPAELHQLESRPPRLHQVERRVEVGVDEVRHLHAVELFEPVAEPTEGLGLLAVGELADLLRHRLASVAHEQGAAVGVAGPVHRVDLVDRDEVGHVGTGRFERVGQQVRHGEHGRAVVEPEPVLDDHAGAAAGDGVTLDDGDGVPRLRQVRRRREPTEARPHHDHLEGTSGSQRAPAGHTCRQLT